MSRKVNDSYEYKEAPMKRALEYASFGWLIGKNSEHYSKKEKANVVTLRRDFVIGANPTISDCEKDYLKLEQGKIPVKYRDHVLLHFLGRLFLIIITLVFFCVGVAGAAVGVFDGLTSNSRIKALYNCAAECGLVKGDPLLLADDDPDGNGLTKGFLKFRAENPTLDTFSELVDFAKDRVTEDELLGAYKKALFYFGAIDDMNDESVYGADATAKKGEDGYPEDDGVLTTVLDPLRKVFAMINFDAVLPDLPVWVNTVSLIGGGALFIFVIFAVIGGVSRKKRKLKRRKKCAVIMQDCIKQASDALYELKNENKELMTKQDRELAGYEDVFSKVVAPVMEADDYD